VPQLIRRPIFDALVDLSPDPVWIVDASGNVIHCNTAYTRWWAEIGGASVRIGELQRRAFEGRSIVADVRLIVAGVERTYAIHARPTEGEGPVEAVAFTARDTSRDAPAGTETAIELALMHLFASTEPLSELAERALEFLCATDGWDAAILWQVSGEALRAFAMWFGNDAARERLSARVSQLRFTLGRGVPGRAWSTHEVVWIADILDESTMDRAELSATAGLHSVVAAPLIENERVTGVVEFFTQSVRPINDRGKKTLLQTAAALARLIERRRLIEQIERRGAEWMLTFDSISLPILLTTPDGVFARLNRAAREMAGLDYAGLVGRSIQSLGDTEPWTTLHDTVTAVRDSGMACTAQIVTEAGTWDVAASPLPASAREDERVIIAMRDMSELIRLQESVRRGEQLAALGELVAGVAHEVKNPLFGMGVTLDVLEEQLRGNAESLELTQALRTWIARLQSLTENLLAFGKTWSVDLKPGNVGELLHQTIASVAPRAKENVVAIDSDIHAEEATVLMDGSRLILVFENLLINALQHSRKGEQVHLSARTEGDAAVISVRDHGPGFNPDDLPRVFQPFFTRRRGGTGLGLSIVQRIVDEHGGTVNARNHESGGAELRVQLPLYHQDSE
jgi:signal transduction histidine kinase